MAIKFDTFKVGSGGAGTDTLDDVTGRGATTTNSITVGGVTVGTEYSLPAADGTVSGQVLTTDANGTLSFTTLDFTGGLEYKGTYDITAAPSLTSSKKGDFYIIENGPGTIAGVSFDNNDHIVFSIDASSPLTSAMFDKIDNTDSVTSVNGNTGAVVLSANDLAADHTATNYTATNANIDGHLSGIDTKLGTVASPTLDDVTTNGDTTTNAINVGTITTSGDILADTDATRTIGAEATRFITAHTDINGAIRFKAKNDHGSAISKGQVVYINGINGTVPTVALARANSASTMPAFGLALNDANDQAEVQIITFGNLTDYNTTTYSLSLGDTVYVSDATAGALTNTAPSGESNLIQNIGKVVRAHSSAGIIKVGGAGRSAATPNLNQDKIFLGNASNQAVSTALSSIALTSFNNDLTFPVTSVNSDTGAVVLSGNDIAADHTASNYTAINANIDGHLSGIDTKLGTLGTAAFLDVGTTASKVVQLDGSARLPAVDGSQLTGLPSAPVTSVNTLTGAVVVSGDDIAADHTASNYTAVNANIDGHLSGIDTKFGTLGTAAFLDVGTTASKVVQLDGSARLPAVDGSQLTNLPSAPVTSVNGATGVVVVSGNDIAADHTASNYTATNANIDGHLSGIDTALGSVSGSKPTLTIDTPSTNYNITTTSGIEEIYVLTPSADISVNLPAAATAGDGYKYTIKNLSSTYILTVDPNSTETIDGDATYDINIENQSLTIVADGTNDKWYII